MRNRGNRIALLAVVVGLAIAASVCADENARAVQEKLRGGGFYSGEIDGAYSSQLSAALTRYQIRNGLPITGQLDEDTSKALGAKPAVVDGAAGPQQSSETWRRLRKGELRTSTSARRSETAATEARERSSPTDNETPTTSTEMPPRSAPAAAAANSSANGESASAPPTAASDTSSSAAGITTERLRDYVAAFVLAGLDENVGAETEFFADRVEYYDQGMMDRERIREDLKRYDARWPERQFRLAGDINIERQNDNRVRVTFPLKYELRNDKKHSSGKVDKTLVLERAGDDLQIVAVNERKSE